MVLRSWVRGDVGERFAGRTHHPRAGCSWCGRRSGLTFETLMTMRPSGPDPWTRFRSITLVRCDFLGERGGLYPAGQRHRDGSSWGRRRWRSSLEVRRVLQGPALTTTAVSGALAPPPASTPAMSSPLAPITPTSELTATVVPGR